MPSLTTTLQQQNQAASSGVKSFPTVGQMQKDGVFRDDFNRTSLIPTGGYELYTTGGTGTETISINQHRRMSLVTSGSIGDNASVFTSGLTFSRATWLIDGRTNLEANIIFGPSTAITDLEMFTGLLNSASVQTGLPTTLHHMGVLLDQSNSDNYFLTTANGSTQVTQDTGVAVSSLGKVRLQILWNNLEGGTINLFNGANLDNLASSLAVTAYDNGNNNKDFANPIHFFIETEGAAAKTMLVDEYSVRAS